MVLVLVCVTFSALTIKGRPGFDAAVRGRVDALIARSGSDVAVGFHPLDGRDELLIRPDEEFHAASTMKIPVMIELFRQVRAGAMGLDDRIGRRQRIPQHR